MEPASIVAGLILSSIVVTLACWATFAMSYVPSGHVEQWLGTFPRFGRRVKEAGSHIRLRWIWTPRPLLFNGATTTYMPLQFTVRLPEATCVNPKDGYGYTVTLECDFTVQKAEFMYTRDAYMHLVQQLEDVVDQHVFVSFDTRSDTAKMIENAKKHAQLIKACKEGHVRLDAFNLNVTPSETTAADLRRQWQSRG